MDIFKFIQNLDVSFSVKGVVLSSVCENNAHHCNCHFFMCVQAAKDKLVANIAARNIVVICRKI